MTPKERIKYYLETGQLKKPEAIKELSTLLKNKEEKKPINNYEISIIEDIQSRLAQLELANKFVSGLTQSSRRRRFTKVLNYEFKKYLKKEGKEIINEAVGDLIIEWLKYSKRKE